MSLFSKFALAAEKNPQKTALVFDDRFFSYKELAEGVKKLSAGLRQFGVVKGTHIGVMLENSVEFVQLVFAAADIGAVIVTFYETLSVEDFAMGLKSADVTYIVSRKGYLQGYFDTLGQEFPIKRENVVCVGPSLEGMVSWEGLVCEEGLEDTREMGGDEDDFFIVLTSGSTGAPKPIVISQGAEVRRCAGAWEMHGLRDDDVVLISTPLHHSLALFAILLAFYYGLTAVLMKRFTKEAFLEVIQRYGATYAVSTSDQLSRVVEEFENGGSGKLRVTLATSSPVKGNLRERLLETPCGLYECYGTTETGFATNIGPEEIKRNPRTVGRACPGVEIFITDDDMRPIPAGDVGEIVIRTPLMFSRYYKNPEATAKSLIDGCFYSGDLGRMDEDGYVYYIGRKKELIKSGGISVFPLDIENVLNRHPKVKESAVIGIEDKQRGEAVFALVMPKEWNGLSEDELRAFCAANLADHQQPVAFEFVEDFPRSGPGKIMKKVLVEKYKKVNINKRFPG